MPDSVIADLLEAARWAPSAHNRQPWRYVIIRDPGIKKHFAGRMASQLRSDLESDGVPGPVIKADTERSQKRLNAAPVLLLVCVSMADMDDYPDDRRSQHEYEMAVQSIAMSAQNVLLTAHAHGLGAVWLCAPLFCPGTVRNALDLPDDFLPQGVIALGYPDPDNPGTSKPRRPHSDWTIYR